MGVAKQPFQLKILLSGSEKPTVFDGVEEFVSGFKYLYVRTGNQTLSFHRDTVASVHRRMVLEGDWLPVNMRNPAK